MSLDHSTLTTLRQQHPAWRLLAAEHAPLVASFLHRVAARRIDLLAAER